MAADDEQHRNGLDPIYGGQTHFVATLLAKLLDVFCNPDQRQINGKVTFMYKEKIAYQ